MDGLSKVRRRTVEWKDPSQYITPSKTMGGLELLREVVAGRLDPPPIAYLVGMRLASVDTSRAVFEWEPAEFMYSPLGTVHGGILTVLLDSAMGCALHTTLPAGMGYTTLELKVNFLRPVTEHVGAMRAEGRVLHAGGTVGTAEARLMDAGEKVYAHSTSTLLIFPSGDRIAAPAPESRRPRKSPS